ncbi:MAG: hypothetical protein ABEJ67_05140 [Halanaeroarchaeum sp.]
MSKLSLSRREALASGFLGVVTATAGCASLGGANGTLDERSKRTLRLSLSRGQASLRESFVETLSETRSTEDETAFRTTLDGDTYTTQTYPPFRSHPGDPVYTRHEGTYYELGSVVVNETSVSRPVLRLFEETDPPASSSLTAAGDLPPSDQRAVKIAYFAARARGNEGGAPWGLVQRGGYVYRRREAIAASALLADGAPRYVRYREDTYRVDVEHEPFHEPVYKATVVPVAESPEQMESILRAKFVDARFSREDISAAANDVIASARMDSYSETHPYSEGYQAVLRALNERAYIDGNVQKDAGIDDDGHQMVLYGDTYFDYRLRLLHTY